MARAHARRQDGKPSGTCKLNIRFSYAEKDPGRLCPLRGKNKPIYTPHVDCGDYVIVINAEKVEVTGKKRKEKVYKRHTGYPGGLREVTFDKLQAKKPEEIIRHAVKGMLPNGKLGRQMFKKLKVYAGPEHAHAAQKPETLEF